MGLTYDELTDLTAISRSTVYKITTEYSKPTLKSIFQTTIAFGLHSSVLLSDYRSLQGWNEIITADPYPSVFDETLENTTERMNRTLRKEEDEDFDPALWLSKVEEAAQEMASYYPTPGGILGAVICRHHGGEKGAYLASRFGHEKRNEACRENLGGFTFPGRFVEQRLKQKTSQG